MYEQGDSVIIIEPKYNGIMLNNSKSTLALGLELIRAERTWNSGREGVNENKYDESYGCNHGKWEKHPC